jgi:hypothetical protein
MQIIARFLFKEVVSALQIASGFDIVDLKNQSYGCDSPFTLKHLTYFQLSLEI